MNPLDETHFKRLQRAVDVNLKRLQPFREQQQEFVRQFVGNNYSENGAEDRVPINGMELAANIFTRLLVPNAPRSLVRTRFPTFKPVAANLELALNRLIDIIRLGTTLRRAVSNAMFSLGIVKCAVAHEGTVEIDGFTHAAGMPFGDVVHLDDWVVDMSARQIERAQIMGDRYRLPFDHVMESPFYSKKARAKLKKMENYDTNQDGDERTETLGRGRGPTDEDLKDMVELWDIWLPEEELIVTYCPECDAPPLSVIKWSGPQEGPYHVLGFTEVPNNVMPLPPAALWMDTHLLINSNFRKMGRQADRQKTILGVAGDAKRDGDKVVRANDGEAVILQNPDRMREYRFGGVDEANMAFGVYILDLFKVMNGNLDMLGGLGIQSPTLGQEQLVQESANKRAADMSERTIQWTEGIVKALAHFLWYDPTIELPLVKPVKGTTRQVATTWNAEARRGDFLHYNVGIDVFSMQHQTPASRLNKVVQIAQQLLLPLAPMLEQQGKTVNVGALVDIIAKYSDLQAEFSDLIISQTPSALALPGPVGEPPRKAAFTERRNVRVQAPGQMTPQGKSSVLMSELLGKGRQGKERAGLFRQAG